MVLGMSSQQSRNLATLLKLLSGVSAHGVEQTILYRLAGRFDRDERLGHEITDVRGDIGLRSLIITHHSDRGFENKGAHEYRQATQDHALILRQQLIAPIDRGGQSLMSRQIRPSSLGQQLETIIEKREQFRSRECIGTSGRQFDRQRDTVQAPADLSHYLYVAFVQ